MIIFVGEKTRGYFIEDIAKKWKMEFDYIPSRNSIKQHTNEILAHRCTFVVYEVEQYTDDADEIADEISRISKANNSKPIIFARGYLPASEMMMRLYEHNIKNIIFAIDLAAQKDELEKCMNGYFDANTIDVLTKTEEALKTEKKTQIEFKRIGISGCCNRIGTTTQAVQIVKYLNLKGYRACYIEMNSNKYVESLAYYYEAEEHNKEIGKVSFENVDMFYLQEKISDILKLGYDYYIYDYGVYTDTSFNKTSFLEKDIRMFVVGSKADEMEYTTAIIDNCFYDDVFYLYNFTPLADQRSIRELMEEKKDSTFFTEYTPDPFVYSNSNIYEQMIPVEARTTEKKKKKGWFKKK